MKIGISGVSGVGVEDEVMAAMFSCGHSTNYRIKEIE
jgi:hypothetical protein